MFNDAFQHLFSLFLKLRFLTFAATGSCKWKLTCWLMGSLSITSVWCKILPVFQGLFLLETELHHCSTESIFLHYQKEHRVKKRWMTAANGRCCFLALLHEEMLLRACLILSISGPAKIGKTSHGISVLLGCPHIFGTFVGQWHLQAGFFPLPSLKLFFHKFLMY